MSDGTRRKIIFGKLSIGDKFFLSKEAQETHTKIEPQFGPYVLGKGNLVLTASELSGRKLAVDCAKAVYIEEKLHG